VLERFLRLFGPKDFDLSTSIFGTLRIKHTMQNSAPNLVNMAVVRRRKRLRTPDVEIALLYHLRAVDKNIIEKITILKIKQFAIIQTLIVPQSEILRNWGLRDANSLF